MAILDYVKLYKDKGKDSWSKLQGRQKVIFAGTGIAIVTLFVVLVASIGGGTGGMVALKVPVNDPEAAIRKLAIFGIDSNFSDKENAVMVPEDKELRAARILSSAKLLPNGDKAYGFVKESNLAQTDSARQLAYRVELQSVLSETIGAMQGVDTAIVNLTPPSRPYYYRFKQEDLRAKASVMIEASDNRPLVQAQVLSIAQLVAGAMETMNAENVYISDTTGRHYPIDGEWRQAFSVMEVTLNSKAEIERNVLELLSPYNPRVAATIEIRTGEIEEKERLVDDKTKGIDAYAETREHASLTTNLYGTTGDEAAAGRNANNDPGKGKVDTKKDEAESRIKKDYSYKETMRKDDTIKPDYAQSSIAVTISEEFTISAEKRAELVKNVSAATRIPEANISIVQTPPLQPELMGAGMSGPWASLLEPQNVVKVVLLVLALAAFVALMVMMKKSAPKPLTLVDDEFVEEDDEPLPEIPTLPPVDQLSGNLVREKVVDLVRKNPKAAANLIKRWVIIGK